MNRAVPVCMLVFLLAMPFGVLCSEPLRLSGGWGIDPPTGWTLIDAQDDKITFAPPGESAYLQIKRYPGERWTDVREMFDNLVEETEADINDSELYRYRHRDACFADLMLFPGGGIAFRAYMILLEGERYDTVLLAMSDPADFLGYSTVLLSALDSFSLGDSGRLRPGPAMAYLFPKEPGNKALAHFYFEGDEYRFSYSQEDLEAGEYLIEREAGLLVSYSGTGLEDQAWKRYYRMVYRDSYHRIEPVLSSFREIIGTEDDSRQKASRLLSWVQGLGYQRRGGVSDLQSPLSVLVDGSGDCDSKGLLLCALYNDLNLPSVLMVSSSFAHSLVGVLVPGEGARFQVSGKQFLVAETTDQVEIGLIDRSMADPSQWLGIDFFRY